MIKLGLSITDVEPEAEAEGAAAAAASSDTSDMPDLEDGDAEEDDSTMEQVD